MSRHRSPTMKLVDRSRDKSRAGLQEQPWLRFSAGTVIAVVVKAREYGIEIQLALEACMNAVNERPGGGASSDVRLVGNDHEAVAVRFQRAQSMQDIRENLEIVEAGRRMRDSIAYERAIDDAVSIQENCRPHQISDSHFV